MGWILLLGGLAIGIWRGAIGIHWLREWLHWRVADPSIAERYQIGWWFEGVWTVLALCAAGGGYVVLQGAKNKTASSGRIP